MSFNILITLSSILLVTNMVTIANLKVTKEKLMIEKKRNKTLMGLINLKNKGTTRKYFLTNPISSNSFLNKKNDKI